MRSVFICLAFLSSTILGAVIMSQDFNSNWTTGSPPPGWRIFHTGPAEGSDDWHRKEAGSSPWLSNPTRYAAIFWNLYPDSTPDSLLTEPINCSGFRNIRLRVTTFFNRQLSRPYTAVLCYSVDGGASFITLANYHDRNVDSVKEIFSLPAAENKPSVILAWVFSGDLANIKWWCIDDVRLEGDPIPNYDVACCSIITPRTTILPGELIPAASFANWGRTDQVDVPLTCELYDESMNPLFTWNVTIPYLRAGGPDTTIFFEPPYSLFAGDYHIKFWCWAPNDDNRANDTLSRDFTVSFVEKISYCTDLAAQHLDWPVGHYGWGVKFNTPGGQAVYLESAHVYLRCPPDPAHRRYQLAIYRDAGGRPEPQPYFKTAVLTGYDGWNSVFLADTGEALAFPDGTFYIFYLQVGEPPECPELGIDQTLNYPARVWQYRAGTVLADTPPGDYMIRACVNYESLGDPLVDARTLYVSEPWYDFVQRPFDRPVVPRARIENISTLGTSQNVIVTCSIFGAPRILRYADAVAVENLPNSSDTIVSFRPWVPTAAERCSVIVQTRVMPVIRPDTVYQNNDKRFTVDIIKGAHTGTSGLGYGWIDSDTTDGPTFNWIDTSGAYVAIASGDEARIFVPIGFDFPYYDTSYNFVYVCTNGWLALGADQGTNESVPSALPNPALPNRCIYPWWDNFAFGSQYGGGKVYFKNQGLPPNRTFTVIWQDAWRVRPGANTSDRVSFEVTLHENGAVVFQYADVTTGNLLFDGGRYASVGLENADGTDGLNYLYGRAPLSSSVHGLANRLTAGRAIRLSKLYKDAAVSELSVPERFAFPGRISPVVKIRNLGSIRDTIRTYLHIRPTTGSYDAMVQIPGLKPGDSALVTFPPYDFSVGTYVAVCSTKMRGDVADSNDALSTVFFISPWVQREDIPPGWFRRRIKNATLAYAPTTKRLYAMKGSGTNELWSYDLSTRKWEALAPMPLAPSGGRAKDGCDLTFDPLHGTLGSLWAIKGGGRTDFYRYDIAKDTWESKNPVYLGQLWSYRPPKKGAALAFVPNHGQEGTVYCIPGNGSNNLYRYDVRTDLWSAAADIPSPPPNAFAKCRYGSDMVFDGDSFLYVMKGSNTLDIFAYWPLANTWVDTLDQASLLGPRSKRIKSGASMAYLNGRLVVLKGGNTQELWGYKFGARDSWVPLTDIPLAYSGPQRKIKRGSSMVAVDSTIYCLKGSYSNEFWEYKPSADPAWTEELGQSAANGEIAANESELLLEPQLWLHPKPAQNAVVIHYTVAAAGRTRIRVFDRAGRLVSTLLDGPTAPGRHATVWNCAEVLTPGIYVVRMETGGSVLAEKLVVQR